MGALSPQEAGRGSAWGEGNMWPLPPGGRRQLCGPSFPTSNWTTPLLATWAPPTIRSKVPTTHCAQETSTASPPLTTPTSAPLLPAPATLVLKQAKHGPAPGPLHMLLLLPGTHSYTPLTPFVADSFSPQDSAEHPPPTGVCLDHLTWRGCLHPCHLEQVTQSLWALASPCQDSCSLPRSRQGPERS